MTAAYETPPVTVDTPARPAGSPAATVPGTLTGSLLLVGLCTVAISAWGGIVPYVGPVFGYGATGTGSWTWNLGHGVLALAPGGVGVVCGLAIIYAAGRNALGLGRSGLALAGLAAIASGAWFVVGPAAWPVIEHGAAYFTAASAYRHLLDTIGYAFGPGVILAAFGGFTLAKSLRHRVASSATALAPAGMAAGGVPSGGHLRRVPEPPAERPVPAPEQPTSAPRSTADPPS